MKLTSNQKKVTATSTAIAGVAIATALYAGLSVENKTEIPYSINVINQYSSELVVTPPKSEKVDLVKLYLNDNFVDVASMTNDSLKSIPLMFTDLDNLTVECYSENEVVGIIEFDDTENKCYYIEK